MEAPRSDKAMAQCLLDTEGSWSWMSQEGSLPMTVSAAFKGKTVPSVVRRRGSGSEEVFGCAFITIATSRFGGRITKDAGFFQKIKGVLVCVRGWGS